MVQGTATAWSGTAWETLTALVETDGTAAHPFARRLRAGGPRRAVAEAGGVDQRELCDAAHALCAIHGTHPGMADEALGRMGRGLASAWSEEVAAAFGRERQLLARVVSAAGPLPSTPGQAATDAAFAAQRHAFQMLARSDRAGVAAGAVAALALDWAAIRGVLARAADGGGLTPPPLTLPAPEETAVVVATVAEGPAAERALLFGARALLEQHRAFWTVLEARAAAREG